MTSHRTTLHRSRTPGTPLSLGPRHRRRTLPAWQTRLMTADRGDVPGWVLITLMTAALVVAIWAVASDQLVAIFERALEPFSDGTPD